MRVRQLYGSRAGEIVEMPYHVVVRALQSGTVALIEDPPSSRRPRVGANAPRPAATTTRSPRPPTRR